MKASELRDMTADELNAVIAQKRKDLFELRSKSVVGQLPNPHLMREYKKDIARCMTLLSEKAAAGGGQG